MNRCPSCNHLTPYLAAITSPKQLESTAEMLRTLISAGSLIIQYGDLQWDDHIFCEVGCDACGFRYRLSCDTYHGRGGTFERI